MHPRHLFLFLLAVLLSACANDNAQPAADAGQEGGPAESSGQSQAAAIVEHYGHDFRGCYDENPEGPPTMEIYAEGDSLQGWLKPRTEWTEMNSIRVLSQSKMRQRFREEVSEIDASIEAGPISLHHVRDSFRVDGELFPTSYLALFQGMPVPLQKVPCGDSAPGQKGPSEAPSTSGL